jgi:SNF2 family DNA or RNA helicase
MPGYLRSLKRFRDDFIGAEDSDLAHQRLHRMVSPFLLRRIKKEVLLELPDINRNRFSGANWGPCRKRLICR